MRPYGVSVVSLVPYSWGFAYGFERAVSFIRRAGYDGFQVLPLRGWNLADPRINEYVLSYEDAWDTPNLWAIIEAKMAGDDRASFQNWFLYSRQAAPWFKRGVFSTHHFGYPIRSLMPTVVEVHPELSLDIGDYVRFAEQGGRLCIDMKHIRRPHRDGTANFAWRDLLDALPPESIGLIHIQPINSAELDAFVSGRATEMGEMLKLLKRKAPQVPAIVEIFPPLTLDPIGYFRKLRERASESLDW